jgi:small conductance mechanosensitive channel
VEPNLSQAFDAGVQKVSGWVEALIQNLPEILAAAVVLGLSVLLARGARAVARRVMDRATDHGPVKGLVATFAYVAVLAAGVFLALGVLELDRTVASLLAGVGIVGLALGFAFQDIAENFIAGILLTVRRPFTDGDLVETNGYRGRVEAVDLRSTHVRTPRGELVRIPNGEVYGSPLTNYSQSEARRVDLSCGVSYGDDLEKARRVALEAMEGVDGRDPDRDAECFFEEFGGSSIDFTLRFWLVDAEQRTFLRARSDAVIRLKKAFDEHDVGIPFPITTLDFSEAGTRRLDEALEGFQAAVP